MKGDTDIELNAGNLITDERRTCNYDSYQCAAYALLSAPLLLPSSSITGCCPFVNLTDGQTAGVLKLAVCRRRTRKMSSVMVELS